MLSLEEAKVLLKKGEKVHNGDEGHLIGGLPIGSDVFAEVQSWLDELEAHYKYRIDLGEEIHFIFTVYNTDTWIGEDGHQDWAPSVRVMSLNDVLIPYVLANVLMEYWIGRDRSVAANAVNLLKKTHRELYEVQLRAEIKLEDSRAGEAVLSK